MAFRNLVAGLAMALVATAAVAEEKRHELTMATAWSGGPLMEIGAQAFAERVRQMSDGRIEIEVFPAGTLGPALKVAETVQNGVADMGHTWIGYDWGADPTAVKYIPYDAGGKAMAGLLSGEIRALSTGFSEAAEMAKQGQVNILCVTAPERLPEYPDFPTCREQGADAEFVNWRGFFGPPGLPEDKRAAYIAMFEKMYATPEWEEVRSRNGWVNIFKPGDEFSAFLETQEQQIADMMRQLGFL